MSDHIKEHVAKFLGLVIILWGATVLLFDGRVTGFTSAWAPVFRELSTPITIGLTVFGFGLLCRAARRISGAILALILVSTWCLTVYFNWFPKEAVMLSEQEIPEELRQWKLALNGQWPSSAPLPQLAFRADAPGTMGIKIRSTTSERDPTDIQVKRDGIELVKGEGYLLRFRARASGVRPIYAAVGYTTGENHEVVLHQALTLADTWQPFEIAFEARETIANANMTFDLGEAAKWVELNSVTLVRQPPDATPPMARVWELNQYRPTDDSPVLAQLEFPGTPPQSLRVRILRTTRERLSWHIQLARPGVAVVKGKFYILRFRARSRAYRTINAAVGRAHGDWASLGLYQLVPITTEWERHSLTFQATENESNARILFDMGHRAEDVEISNITLLPTDAAIPDFASNTSYQGEIIFGGDDVEEPATPPQNAVFRGTIWLQIIGKPLLLLILLWSSRLIGARSARPMRAQMASRVN